MKTLLNTSVVLGVLLSAPVMTYPAASASAPAMDRAHPRHKASFADAKALAPLWATLAAVARPSAREIAGLSRNPDDCAKYGCIDNGGN
jgi:glutamate synthase domain-containing protein 1